MLPLNEAGGSALCYLLGCSLAGGIGLRDAVFGCPKGPFYSVPLRRDMGFPALLGGGLGCPCWGLEAIAFMFGDGGRGGIRRETKRVIRIARQT